MFLNPKEIPVWCCFSLRKHIDFETVIRRYYEEPVCMTEFSSRLELDNLPGMINRDRLQYQPESGLREVGIWLLRKYLCH